MKLLVVQHDPQWRSRFEAEAERIVGALGAVAFRLHHIGSTAVPGLAAKPIIDILWEATELSAIDESNRKMAALGYEVMGEFGIPGRRYFRRTDAQGIRTHQVHAFRAGSPDLERHLAFRDYLIANPDIAGAYGELKLRLARRHPHDIEAYMDGKDGFVKLHEQRALAWRSMQHDQAATGGVHLGDQLP